VCETGLASGVCIDYVSDLIHGHLTAVHGTKSLLSVDVIRNDFIVIAFRVSSFVYLQMHFQRN